MLPLSLYILPSSFNMAFAAEPAKQVPRPPGNHIQNASVGEGGLGVFAEVTDARKFENVFNLEGPTVVLPGHQGIEDDNHLFNSLFQTGRARMPVGQGHGSSHLSTVDMRCWPTSS